MSELTSTGIPGEDSASLGSFMLGSRGSLHADVGFQSDSVQQDAFQTEVTSTGTSANAGNAAGTGVANDANVALTVNSESTSGTGAAYDATVATSADANAPAGLTSGTGTSYQQIASISINAESTSGSGVAHGPTAGAATAPELASGTGAAFDATVMVSGNPVRNFVVIVG